MLVFYASCLSRQEALDLQFHSADAVRFVPMNFGLRDCTIGKTDSRNTLHLPPSARPVSSAQAAQLADRPTNCDFSNLTDLSEHFNGHAHFSTNT